MSEKRVLPQVDAGNCSLCGLCAEACACGAVSMSECGPVFACPEAEADEAARPCTCLCEEVCPSGAIAVEFEIVASKDATPPADTDSQ